MDTSANAWVSDSQNCRVIKFPPPFSTNESATVVVGQAALGTGCGAAPSASVLGGPGGSIGGAAFDSSGNLWVVDSSNSRVLGFTAAAIGGAAPITATGVIGQGAVAVVPGVPCNQGAANPTALTLCNPTYVTFDSAGNLWVVDQGNHRVLGYTKARISPLPAVGPAADGVIGQADPTCGGIACAPNTPDTTHGLNGPTAAVFDSTGNLLVSDTGNNRVVSYPKASVSPLPLGANGPAATLAIGQPVATNLISTAANNGGIGPATLNGPVV